MQQTASSNDVQVKMGDEEEQEEDLSGQTVDPQIRWLGVYLGYDGIRSRPLCSGGARARLSGAGPWTTGATGPAGTSPAASPALVPALLIGGGVVLHRAD
ncbi:unnamed protein product [Lota lota]